MQKTKKITLLNNSITINKSKLEYTIAAISYAALCFARILLIIASVVFCILFVGAGGDGHLSDGDPALMFIMLGLSVICGLAARLTIMFTTMIIEAQRNKK